MKKTIILSFVMILLVSGVYAYPYSGVARDKLWNRSEGVLSFSQNVGVGIINPSETLSVEGNIDTTGNISIGEKIIFNLDETIDNLIDGFFSITGGLIVSKNINVTGNATFDQGIVLGNYATKPTCEENSIAKIVFDTTLGKPYICNGSSWKPIDSDHDLDGYITGDGTIDEGSFSGYSYDCNDSNTSIGYSSDGSCDGDSDNYIDVLAGGNDCNDSNSETYPNSLCGYDSSCVLLTDDSNCGTIDCDSLNSYFDNGTDSATGTNYCVLTDYADITTNRCEGINDCKDANSDDCTSAVNSTVATCGTCEYCDGSSCADYAEGIDTGDCRECDGAGGEQMPTDDDDCGTIDCSSYYAQSGTESATTTETCYNKLDLSTSRCEALGDCKDANTADCSSQSNDASQYTCGTCKYIGASDCTGTTLGSCSNYDEGTDSGSCRECDGSGGEQMPADDSDCGTIDCSSYYAQSGTEGVLTTETCYNKIDITTSRCEALGDCKDANTADCSSQSNDASQYTCAKCQYIGASDCTGTTLGSCSNYGSGTSCADFTAEGVTCDGSGSCDYDSYTVLMMHMEDSDLPDETGKTVTLNGNVARSSTQEQFGSYSAYFDGTTDYLSISDSDDWNFGSGDFTIDFWFYGTALNDQFIGQNEDASANYWRIATNSLRRINFISRHENSYIHLIETDDAVPENTWTHIALSRSGSNFYFFLDGTMCYTLSDSDALFDLDAPLYIGHDPSGSGYSTITGYIDEVRISKGIARWTSGFTPPSGPYSP